MSCDRILTFGEFRLDPVSGHLYRQDAPRAARAQVVCAAPVPGQPGRAAGVVRDVLPSIRVPTLVIHRTGDLLLKVEEGRYRAARIPGAAMVELPGDDHLPFVGDQDTLLDAVDSFLAPARERSRPTTVLCSVVTLQSDAAGDDRELLARMFARRLAVPADFSRRLTNGSA